VACITLTRITLPRDFTCLPSLGWEVAYEGRVIATYAEERDGWLHQLRSSSLDASLRGRVSTWGPAKGFPNLDAPGHLRAACQDMGGTAGRHFTLIRPFRLRSAKALLPLPISPCFAAAWLLPRFLGEDY
jgi:hypothetical protein